MLRTSGLRAALNRVRQKLHAPDDYSLFALWKELSEHGSFHASAPAGLYRRSKVVLVGDLNLPQCRKFRVEQMREIFELMEIEYAYAHIADPLRWRGLLQGATHVVLYRVPANNVLYELMYEVRRLNLPVLYDIDDPIFSLPAYATYGNMRYVEAGLRDGMMRGAPSYAAAMQMADAVSVSTPRLAQVAASFVTSPIFLRRNFCDQEMISRKPSPKAAKFTLCFSSGSQGHEADFEIIAEAVIQFVCAAPNRRLLLLGHFNIAHLPHELRKYTEHIPFQNYATYLQALSTAHVNLLPLEDCDFNRCKSAVRVLDAASVGVQSLASPVGDVDAVLTDPTMGQLVTGSWQEALSQLSIEPNPAQIAHWRASLAPHIIDPNMIKWFQS